MDGVWEENVCGNESPTGAAVREADGSLQRHISRLLVVGIVASAAEAEVTGVLASADEGRVTAVASVSREERMCGGDITGPASPKRPRRPHPRLW